MNRKNFVMTALAAFTLVLASCDKDDNNTNNNVVSKSNLAMSGSQEVPAVTTSASGSVNVSYNKTTRMLNFTVNWAGLSGTPTGAHIHGTAAKGANAPVKYNFFSSIPMTASGSYSGSTMVDGVAIKEDSLLNGFYYINIHTPTNPNGEIRTQLDFK